MQVDLTAGFYDTAPQHTAEVLARMEQQFANQPPFDAEGFLRVYRQKLREPGQAVIVIDSISPMVV